MAARKPLVRIGGQNVQLPAGDTLVGVSDDTKLPIAGGKMTGALNEALIRTHDLNSGVGIGGGYIVDNDLILTNTVQATGSSDFVGFGSLPAGAIRRVIFTGTPWIRYNASKMILLTGADIRAASGDIATFESLGFDDGQTIGNWKMIGYARFDGTALITSTGSAGDFRSNGTVQMTGAFNEANPGGYSVSPADGVINGTSVAASNTITVVGAGPLTGMAAAPAGAIRRLKFAAAMQITSSLNFGCLTGDSIQARNGDMAVMQSVGTGQWQMVDYQRGDGTPLVSVATPDNTKLPLAGGTMMGAFNENYGSASIDGGGKLVFTDCNGAFVSGSVGQQINGITDAKVTAAGATRRVTFVSPGIILVHSNNFVLPTQANITVQNGDSVVLQAEAAANAWRVINYERADGTALVAPAGFTQAQVRSTPMTGVTLTDKTAVAATDTLLTAIGKLQAQLNNGLFRKESITAGSVGKTSWAVPGGYTAGAILVILNGALLDAADYIATDGINITGVTSTNARDVMNVIVFGVLRAQDDALLSYTVAQLNTQGAAANALKVRWCSNANGGACMVVSNGTNWVRVADNAILTV